MRDLSAVEQSVNAALSLDWWMSHDGGTDSSFTAGGGVSNSTVIPSLDNTGGTPGWVATATDTKGDLVVLGDYNGDGAFNGQDLYLLGIGASLTSANSTTNLNATVTTFADAVRDHRHAAEEHRAELGQQLSEFDERITRRRRRILSMRPPRWKGYNPRHDVDTHTVNPVTGKENYIPWVSHDSAQDSVTGLEQYTFDPTGTNAFNPSDVLREDGGLQRRGRRR